MTGHRGVVAVGASAGGVEALRALVAELPPDFPAAILVVLHIPRDAPSALPAILTRSGQLPARQAVDGEPVRPGRIYVATNDRHLLLLDGRLRLSRGPAENNHRPAVDPLFRSVARAAGRRAVGVVLSGSRDDGAAGLASIAAAGGVAVVQKPSDALHPGMPEAALAAVAPDHSLPAAELGGLLARIFAMDVSSPRRLPDDPPRDAGVAISDLESALVVALRALEEKSSLGRRMADRQPQAVSGSRFREMADDAAAAGETIRRLIGRLGSAPSDADPEVR